MVYGTDVFMGTMYEHRENTNKMTYKKGMKKKEKKWKKKTE